MNFNNFFLCKLDALPLSKRFKSLSIEGNSVTPHQGKNVKGGWERQKRRRLLKAIIGDVLREDEDNVLSASDLENAFANHIAVKLYWPGVTNQVLVGTVKDTFKGCSYDFCSKCYYGVDLKSKHILEFSSAFGSPMSVVERYGFQEVEYQPLNNLLKNVVKLGEKLQES